LALDLGDRRVGLAVGGDGTDLVLPAGHIIRIKLAQDMERVLEIAKDRGAESIVVGIPYNQEGKLGPQAKKVQRFVRALRKKTGMTVYTVDERFTSVEAQGLLREAGRQPSRDKGSVDEAAAVLILRRFLESRDVEAGSDL
jgi:putative Holliday junction resolvase